MSHKRILIMAGGTGGHIYPALAVADDLLARGAEILWLGTGSGLEARVVPAKGYTLATIHISGLRGKGLLRLLIAPFKLLRALFQSLLIMRRFQPDVVLGMGGYVSGAGGFAAWLLRIPLYIHEQNAIAGLTNRLLSPLAGKVMQGFPGTFKSNNKLHTTGNPVREEIIRTATSREKRSQKDQNEICLLVLGGSLGARALNQIVPAALTCLPAEQKFQIWHQSGPQHFQATKSSYEEHGIQSARVEAYIEDMDSAYLWADLVLCRAGALTLAELCVVGLAAILVPFPFAVDDHQTANARCMTDPGAAVLLPESELSAVSLSSILSDLYRSSARLQEMTEKAKKLGCPQATTAVADLCLEVAHA